MNRKVAFVATVYSHLSVFHLPYMRMLQQEGYEVHAFASADHCKADVEIEGMVCWDVPFSRNPFSPNNIRALKQLLSLFKQEKYDLVHVHTPVASIVCRIATGLTEMKNVIYTAHGFHFFKGASWKEWLIYYPVERLMARWTDVLITINEEDYKRAQSFKVRNKVVYIPGVGVDIPRYRNADRKRVEEIRDEFGLEKETFTIMCIAEFIPRKNHEQLIRAVQALKEQGVRLVCILAGVGRLEKQLRERIEELGISDLFKFAGFRRDVPDLLQLADTVVLLSRQEGLPKVLMEAAATGKPMVVTDIRGNREIVVPHENGYRVNVEDWENTARVLQELSANKILRERMSRDSLDKSASFDLNKIRDQLRSLYSEFIPLLESRSHDSEGEGMVL